MPEKRDFIEAVKRPLIEAVKRPLIVKLLEMMGFEYKRTGRHPIFHHPETPGQVVVPHSVQAPGTRGSIFDQAKLVLERLNENKVV